MREQGIDADRLGRWLADSLALTLELVGDLDGERELGERLAIVNPARWEVGHVAWFAERWVLRHGLGLAAEDERRDPAFDSMVLAHDRRWETELPDLEAARGWLRRVHARVGEHLERAAGERALRDLVLLALFHQDMHNEAFAYTRQTHGWPATPRLAAPPEGPGDAAAGDHEHPGGRVRVGADAEAAFSFDNEHTAHERTLAPFALARAPVTQGEFRRFVEDGGYRRTELWSEEGRAFLARAGATAPLYWRRGSEGGGWQRLRFGSQEPLVDAQPMVHVSWFEADAYARWCGRRLPDEAEWEAAARATPRELLRPHAWEWTASDFRPYAGFEPGTYADYSAPWFGDRKVLRGASWLTPERMRWPSFRNFYEPWRRDVWCGFRTAAR